MRLLQALFRQACYLLAVGITITAYAEPLSQPLSQQIQQPSLIIASWNLQWLSVTEKKQKMRRSHTDLEQLGKIIADISPDIFAFQEVDSKEAIMAILPTHDYQIYLSDRSHDPAEQFSNQNQFTGFAVKSSLTVIDKPDLKALNLMYRKPQKHKMKTRKLRYGSYISIKTSLSSDLHILNIHLKSGCFSRQYSRTSTSCRILKQQTKVLANWIQDRNKRNEDYLVVGDFNHRLNSKQQWLYSTLNNLLPSPAILLSQNIAANCTVRYSNKRGNTQLRNYRFLIDHALSSKSIANLINQKGKVFQYQYPANASAQYQLSDHCPLVLHYSH